MNTLTTKQFLELRPEAQQDVILADVTSAKLQVKKLGEELFKLSGWINTVNAPHATTEFARSFTDLNTQVEEKLDDLTERIVEFDAICTTLVESFQQKAINDLKKTA